MSNEQYDVIGDITDCFGHVNNNFTHTGTLENGQVLDIFSFFFLLVFFLQLKWNLFSFRLETFVLVCSCFFATLILRVSPT